jgi:cellulose synthase (UDP-forming)
MIRIKKQRNTKYAYALDRADSWKIKLIGILGLFSLAVMIVGFTSFLLVSPVISLLLGPLLILIILYQAVQYVLLAKYPGFDAVKHAKKVRAFRQSGTRSKVAVLIPASGEDLKTVAETVRRAVAIDYPAYRVFLLDDSKDGRYKVISDHFGCFYSRRPDVGVDKKAGNLNYAINRLQQYDYYLVLDADFVPRPEIIYEMLPYADEDVGIVQTPQHFSTSKEVYKRSKIEYGAAYIQEDFYRITQVVNNRYGSAICVGTNALYSRKALAKVGGFEGVGHGHSEDVNTGLKMINSRNENGQRYRLEYVPIQLATGTCPDRHDAFYKQQNRWCTGSIQLMFTRKTIFSPHLSRAQKMCYGSNALYYFYSIDLLITPIYILVIALLGETIDWRYTLLFLPMLITNYIVAPTVLRKAFRPITTSLVVLSNAYTFVHAFFLLMIRKPLGWEATGSKAKAKSWHFTQFKILTSICFIMLYIVTLGAILFNENYTLTASIIIVSLFFTSFAAHVLLVFYMLLNNIEWRRAYADRKVYASVFIVLLIVGVSGISLKLGRNYDLTMHNSLTVRLVRETAQ